MCACVMLVNDVWMRCAAFDKLGTVSRFFNAFD